MNIQINSGGHNDLYDAAASALLDNSVAGSEREEVYHNEITNPQSGSERKSGEKRDEKSISKPYVVNSSTKYTTKTSQQQQHKTISTTQRTNDNSLTNQPNDENIPKNDESKKPEANNDRGNSKEINEPKPVATIKPDDNVQLQKSIQIYENEDESKEFINYNQNIESDKKTGRGIVIGQVITESINPQTESDITDDQIPFGTRIRPKRF
ncbi:hypothetical protein O3M35_008786 [Rhynocoris fuscipes]|uniref:Uncharacterized protein n=1 Tax=Rhynocoris fuscipes TaxID=488301 RepID=A0AAW1DEV0_9HEMI